MIFLITEPLKVFIHEYKLSGISPSVYKVDIPKNNSWETIEHNDMLSNILILPNTKQALEGIVDYGHIPLYDIAMIFPSPDCIGWGLENNYNDIIDNAIMYNISRCVIDNMNNIKINDIIFDLYKAWYDRILYRRIRYDNGIKVEYEGLKIPL